jgi:threonyl-tRNA synthetase
MGKKIRDAEMQKTPFMLIVGEEEEKTLFLYVMDKKERKYHRYNRRICNIVNEEINKTLKVFTV